MKGPGAAVVYLFADRSRDMSQLPGLMIDAFFFSS
jgi:hypothetical protein